METEYQDTGNGPFRWLADGESFLDGGTGHLNIEWPTGTGHIHSLSMEAKIGGN